MIPANLDTPLSRSEAARGNVSLAINDDEAERLEDNNINDTSTFEDNETLKKCLEFYNGNKLSRENVWSLSLIDTLSALLDRHHKSLSNFTMAGSSLEASSKVYGLRVDSIHIDVLRMAAGLNAKKFSEKNLGLDSDDEGGVATGGEGAVDPDASAAGAAALAAGEKTPGKKKNKQKQRRAVCTITKNKETLNARLDSVPLQDPIFGKLNSKVGSINSSNRLMNNVLLTTNSELRLRTNFPIFDPTPLPDCDYTQEIPPTELGQEVIMLPCERLLRLLPRCGELNLRPLHSGYVISDTPDALPDEPEHMHAQNDDDNDHFSAANNADDDYANHMQSMAFDINAECEPVPEPQEFAAILDVDYNDFDDLTSEERTAINRCRGIRKQPVMIEDLRPVDATSQLEYSYRPMDNITRFWAGPAHWKFKRARPSSLAHAAGEHSGAEVTAAVGRASRTTGNARQRSQAAALLARKRYKQLDFSEVHDNLFVKLDDNFKRRRVNIQKKWDNRKLKLPTDMRLDAHMFFRYQYAPGLKLNLEALTETVHGDSIPGCDFDDDAMDDGLMGQDDDLGNEAVPMDMNATQLPDSNMVLENGLDTNGGHLGQDTVLEIPMEFANAPTMVQKIIVPFAKRAKVVDMKNLKKNCSDLITKQLNRTVDESTLPQHKQCHKHEQYTNGIASFKYTLEKLPQLLSHTMAESLSPAIAFYSVLHLSNDFNFRLIQQDDLDDFKIRQIAT